MFQVIPSLPLFIKIGRVSGIFVSFKLNFTSYIDRFDLNLFSSLNLNEKSFTYIACNNNIIIRYACLIIYDPSVFTKHIQ